jgi:hypothetical protein
VSTQINVASFRAETWQELKELLVGMTKGLTGKEPSFDDAWYQRKFDQLQASRKARADGKSETLQEG